MDFNPRSHEGSDDKEIIVLHYVQISIHAPTRGATTSYTLYILYLHISIHAPTRGATTKVLIMSHDLIISIHAPTRGATLMEYQSVS